MLWPLCWWYESLRFTYGFTAKKVQWFGLEATETPLVRVYKDGKKRTDTGGQQRNPVWELSAFFLPMSQIKTSPFGEVTSVQSSCKMLFQWAPVPSIRLCFILSCGVHQASAVKERLPQIIWVWIPALPCGILSASFSQRQLPSLCGRRHMRLHHGRQAVNSDTLCKC